MSVLKSLKGWKLVQSCGKDKKLLVDTGSEVIPLGEGGGSADLNASEGEAGYVKNRTHYAENGIIEVLPETTVQMQSIDEDGGGFYNTLYVAEGLMVGETYIVNWNGETYQCVAYDVYGDVCIGNQQIAIEVGGWEFDEVIETNEPFFMFGGSRKFAYALVPEDITCTLSIRREGEIVHKLDPKYLPKGGVGYEAVEIVEFLPETTVQMSASEPSALTMLYGFANGLSATVNWNGEIYNCIAYTDAYREYYCIGNQQIAIEVGGWEFDEVIESNEPFFIGAYTDGDFVEGFAFAREDGEYTLSIVGEAEVTHKIHAKYLPDYDDLNNVPEFHNVAYSGDYNDLDNVPDTIGTIPIKVGVTTRSDIKKALGQSPFNSLYTIYFTDDKGDIYHLFAYRLEKVYDDIDDWQVSCPLLITKNSRITNVLMDRLTIYFDENGVASSDSKVMYQQLMYLASGLNKVFKLSLDDNGNLTATEV